MKFKMSLVGVGLALGVAVAACGSSNSSSRLPTPAKDAAAAALVPAAIAKSGVLRVASDASHAPDEVLAADGKTIVGMDPDLVTLIAQVLGLRVEISNETFYTIIPGIVAGKYDLGVSSFTDNKTREQLVDFVDYFRAGEAYFVPSGSTTSFDGLDSLCGHKVAVEKGTVEERDATAQSAACTSAGKAAVTVVSFVDQNAADAAVSHGQAEVGFVDSQIAAYMAGASHGRVKVSGVPFSVAPYGLAMAKNGLAPAVVAALKVLIANGDYAKVLAKWSLTEGAITTPTLNGAVS